MSDQPPADTRITAQPPSGASAEDDAAIEQLHRQVALLEEDQRRWRTFGLLTLALLFCLSCGSGVVLVGAGLLSYRLAVQQSELLERAHMEAERARAEAEAARRRAQQARDLAAEKKRQRNEP